MKSLLTGFLYLLCMPGLFGTYIETDGLVVMEVESVDPGTAFALEDDISGFKGNGYFRCLLDSFNLGGEGALTYAFRITDGGRYQLAFRSRIGAGTSSTDFNDTFIRLVDSNGDPLEPVPNDNRATGTWYKTYMNIRNTWSHQASNKDNDAHSLSWELESGQAYSIQISARSKDHLVDRLILWDHDRYSFANKTTGKGPNESAFNALEESAKVVSTWGPYSADPNGNVDTGAFLGWVNVLQQPWIWSFVWSKYLYLAEPELNGSGSWVFIP